MASDGWLMGMVWRGCGTARVWYGVLHREALEVVLEGIWRLRILLLRIEAE